MIEKILYVLCFLSAIIYTENDPKAGNLTRVKTKNVLHSQRSQKPTFESFSVYSEDREMQKEKEYGTWPSPIGAELIAQGTKRFGAIEIDNHEIYWEEMRPLE